MKLELSMCTYLTMEPQECAKFLDQVKNTQEEDYLKLHASHIFTMLFQVFSVNCGLNLTYFHGLGF